MINGYDFDGVVSIGITPTDQDIIITGRSFDEAHIVNKILRERNINCAVYYNPISTNDRETGTEKSRKCSGKHKAEIIYLLKKNGVVLNKFFEDDDIQIKEIKNMHPTLNIVHLVHDLVTK